MNWAQIIDMYDKACGKASGAAQEWPIHVNEGYKALCARMNLEELDKRIGLETISGVDYVPMPADIFHVISVANITTGDKLDPEINGMRGRMQFFDPAGTGLPVSGIPTNYAISGGRLYLRDTPNAIYQLELLGRARPDVVRDTDLDQRPVTPEHLDMAIVFAAARSFFSVHADSDVAAADGTRPSAKADANFNRAIQEPDLPKDRERFDQVGRVYLKGFVMRR